MDGLPYQIAQPVIRLCRIRRIVLLVRVGVFDFVLVGWFGFGLFCFVLAFRAHEHGARVRAFQTGTKLDQVDLADLDDRSFRTIDHLEVGLFAGV